MGNDTTSCRDNHYAPRNMFLITAVWCMLLMMSGCVTISKEDFRHSMTWEPVPASRQIEASVRVESECKFTDDNQQRWKSYLVNTDETIANYQFASCDAIQNDMVRSRIFRRVVSSSDSNYDLLIKLVSIDAGYSKELSLSVVDPKRQDVIASYHGTAISSSFDDSVKRALADIRYEMISDYQDGIGIEKFLIANGKILEPLTRPPKNIIDSSILDGKPIQKSDIDDLPVMQTKLNKNSYAIVIGIEKYRQKLPNADHAVNDAKIMTEYLTKVMGYPEGNVVTLLNEHATNVDFAKYFEKWLLNNVDKDSTVFIYYSGHGAPNVKTGDAYLVPYDGDPSFIEQTGYPLKRLYESLHKLPAKEIIVALDSCFSGAGGKSVIAQGARPLVMNLEQDFQLSKNMIVMSASSGDQISSSYEEKGHGLFTYFLLKGIKDGITEVGELFDYLKPNVRSIARKTLNNEQTPQLISPDKQKVFLRN